MAFPNANRLRGFPKGILLTLPRADVLDHALVISGFSIRPRNPATGERDQDFGSILALVAAPESAYDALLFNRLSKPRAIFRYCPGLGGGVCDCGNQFLAGVVAQHPGKRGIGHQESAVGRCLEHPGRAFGGKMAILLLTPLPFGDVRKSNHQAALDIWHGGDCIPTVPRREVVLKGNGGVLGLGAAQTLLEIGACTLRLNFPRRPADQIGCLQSQKGRGCAVDKCEAQLCIQADIGLRDCVQHDGWGIDHTFRPRSTRFTFIHLEPVKILSPCAGGRQNLNSMPCARGSWLDQFNVSVWRRM